MICARNPTYLLFSTSLLLLASCANPGSSGTGSSVIDEGLAPERLTTIHCATGEAAEWSEIIEATLDADVILFAELHGHPKGLPFHAGVFEDSLGRDADAALCLEFITRDWQYLLDAWSAGVVDGDEVVETLDSVPSNSADSHRPLIELAHGHGVPVVAANSPRIYTRAAKISGFELLNGLSPEQQRLFRVPTVMPSGPYRDGFFEMMSEFGGSAELDEDVEATATEPSPELVAKFRSQALWDSTMADSVLGALDSGAGRVFLAVGSYHANNNGGIVQILKNRRPDAKVVVISFVDELPPLGDSSRGLPPDMADFVTFVGPFPE